MAQKKHKPEEIVVKLRQVDVLVSQGRPVAEAIRAIGVTAKDLTTAVYAAEELEETAKLLVLLRGQKPRLLDQAQIDELNAAFPK